MSSDLFAYTCPPTAACDLISTFETGLDGYTQDNTDNFDWNRIQGDTPSPGTGPVVDHTLETTSGWYMFIETSSPQREGDRARLISPLYSDQNAGCNLDFWYHMFGNNIATLNVFVRPEEEPDRLIFSLSGSQGNQWLNSGVLTIGSEPIPFNLVFEGVRGTSFTGDIAIDDIQFTNDAVGSPPSLVSLSSDMTVAAGSAVQLVCVMLIPGPSQSSSFLGPGRNTPTGADVGVSDGAGQRTQTLSFTSFQPSDAGIYTRLGTGLNGGISTTVTITVERGSDSSESASNSNSNSNSIDSASN